jgi:ATP-binding cassette subfamily F protein 3
MPAAQSLQVVKKGMVINMILACQNICKNFGTTPILNQVSFHVNDREKVAIVGINGAGKSTLFKIIMGELPPDEGDVIFSKGATCGYLAQHQELATENSIYEEVLSIKADVIRLEETIRQLELDMKSVQGVELDRMLNTYTRITHEFEVKNGYAYKSEVIGVLKGLGFIEEDFTRKVTTLSGGQKTRVALGKLLLSNPDIIFLDEPTNHLDMESISWLETFLANYNGAVVVIAHDRYFINKVVTKVIELDNNKATVFEGNYSSYAQKKEQLRETMIKHYLNQQREIKHQEEVITKLRSFNREKSIRRAESREKMLDKVERIDRPTTVNAEMDIRLEPNITSGNDVLTVRDLSKSFGSNQLFEHLEFEIKRGEKIAIIGNNGTGKTTILKIINQIIEADAGEIKYGAKVHIGYYDQEHHVLDMSKTIFDEIQDTYPFMDNTKVRNALAAFLFTNDDVFKLIKDISGGERGRVSLAKLMLSDANFLILDEPTNHLDIISKEILENAITNYTGTVLYVSHDRYFINKTATRILDLTHATLINYVGNYDYYLEKKPEFEYRFFGIGTSVMKEATDNKINVLSGLRVNQTTMSNPTTTSSSMEDTVSETKQDWKQQKEEQARLRKKQNDLKRVEDEIHRLETRNEELNSLLLEERIYTNSNRLMELTQEKKTNDSKLEELLEEWESLSED